MPAQVMPIETIVSDPEVRGGRPVVAGTGLRVTDIAAYHIFSGLSPEQLALQFKLALAEVHAALTYYFTHREELDAEMRANALEAERWERQLASK